MRRPNREINIFSMSALDLFASALGAFVLLTIILLPYYLNESPSSNEAPFAILGISTPAQSYVLVIDMSGSMQQYTQIMIETVSKIIESMGPKRQAQIIGYHEKIVKFHNWLPQYQTVGMDMVNTKKAIAFVKSLAAEFKESTPTHEALIEALNYKVDAIILLTDGAPDTDPYSIVDDITRRNNGAKEIHTIALGQYRAHPQLVTFLESLAKQNRGGFLGVSN